MLITIDGPAGTGKSTVALRVAARLGVDFLDTGAMYRAIGLAAVRREADLEDPRELAFLGGKCHIDFDWSATPPAVLLNGESVGPLLRSAEATRAASYVAVVPAIREMLVGQQRRIGRERRNLVTEGRDQGSIVFPDADAKFYLDADPMERAKRRANQLRARGEIVAVREIYDEIVARDRRDAGRRVGPLAVPADAVVLDTSALSEQQVVERIVSAVRGAPSRSEAKN